MGRRMEKSHDTIVILKKLRNTNILSQTGESGQYNHQKYRKTRRYSNLYSREGGRTVGSGRVASIIE